jgi:cytochrome c
MCSFSEAVHRLGGLALAAAALSGSAPLAAQPAPPAHAVAVPVMVPVKKVAARAVSMTAVAPLPGLGRPATAGELAAWDIDVRPDFKGLPQGAGSVAQGQVIWDAQCASCHGTFGEANNVFSPLVGGTTEDDIKTGHAARLRDPAYPGRSTLMKVATLSTLWDYIRRAMPWNAPKSLKTDEVYAVTAYLLNLGGVLPDDFVLSDRTFAQAQARLPNRNGMSTAHALWPDQPPGRARAPDVKAVACMKNCGAEPTVASLLPDHARNNHGNLAEQNRAVGAQRGVDTRPATDTAAADAVTAGTVSPAVVASSSAAANSAGANSAGPAGSNSAALALLQQHHCLSCHALAGTGVGPSFKDVSVRHAARPDAAAYLSAKILAGGSGVWGPVPMPPQPLAREDAMVMARWLADGAHK